MHLFCLLGCMTVAAYRPGWHHIEHGKLVALPVYAAGRCGKTAA